MDLQDIATTTLAPLLSAPAFGPGLLVVGVAAVVAAVISRTVAAALAALGLVVAAAAALLHEPGTREAALAAGLVLAGVGAAWSGFAQKSLRRRVDALETARAETSEALASLHAWQERSALAAMKARETAVDDGSARDTKSGDAVRLRTPRREA